jgi:hypothetical protein
LIDELLEVSVSEETLARYKLTATPTFYPSIVVNQQSSGWANGIKKRPPKSPLR